MVRRPSLRWPPWAAARALRAAKFVDSRTSMPVWVCGDPGAVEEAAPRPRATAAAVATSPRRWEMVAPTCGWMALARRMT